MNKDIAAALGVSTNTFKYHLAGLLLNLQVRTRTESVVVVTRAGLLEL